MIIKFGKESFAVIACILAAAMSCVLVPAAQAALPAAGRVRPFEPQCTVSVDNPHYSSGAGSVIAKVRFACDSGASQTYNVDRFNLYNCVNFPTCSNVRGVENHSIGTVTVRSGKTETRYVPATGQAGLSNGPGKWSAKIYYYYPGSSTEFNKKSATVDGPL